MNATSKSDDEKDAIAAGGVSKARLLRLGILMAFAMTLHNLPEGFAVAVRVVYDDWTDDGVRDRNA